VRNVGKAGLIVALFALVGLGVYGLIQPDTSGPLSQASATLSHEPTKVLAIMIQDRQLVGARTITAEQDDRLLLRIKSDEAGQFHVDGYHAFATLVPNEEIELLIWTATPGVFSIILDNTKQTIGELVVSSR
jgi:hypothetical protein